MFSTEFLIGWRLVVDECGNVEAGVIDRAAERARDCRGLLTRVGRRWWVYRVRTHAVCGRWRAFPFRRHLAETEREACTVSQTVGAAVEAGRMAQVSTREAVHRDTVLRQEFIEVGVLKREMGKVNTCDVRGCDKYEECSMVYEMSAQNRIFEHD